MPCTYWSIIISTFLHLTAVLGFCFTLYTPPRLEFGGIENYAVTFVTADNGARNNTPQSEPIMTVSNPLRQLHSEQQLTENSRREPSASSISPIKQKEIPRKKNVAIADTTSLVPVRYRLNDAPPARAAHVSNTRMAADSDTVSSFLPSTAVGGQRGPSPYSVPKPPYPTAAREIGFEGSVLLGIQIEDSGIVSHAQILQSSGRSDCDSAALKTIRERWRFRPATFMGKPIAWRQKVLVAYTLQ